MVGGVRCSRLILVAAILALAARSAADAVPAHAGLPDTAIAHPGPAGVGGDTVEAGSPDGVGGAGEAGQAHEADEDGNTGASNRLLFLPDATPIRPGCGYVALHDLFIPSFAIGVTGWFSIAAGASIVPGLDRQVMMVSPKIVPFATDGLAIAAGLLYAARHGEAGAGIVYAGMTAAGASGSGTFGLGWSAARGGEPGRAVILAGFRVRVAAGSEIVSENWFPPNLDPALLSIGWRHATGRMAVDLAACLPAQPGGGGASVVPWISLAYNF